MLGQVCFIGYLCVYVCECGMHACEGQRLMSDVFVSICFSFLRLVLSLALSLSGLAGQ